MSGGGSASGAKARDIGNERHPARLFEGSKAVKLQDQALMAGEQRINLDGVLCMPCDEFLLALRPNHFPA